MDTATSDLAEPFEGKNNCFCADKKQITTLIHDIRTLLDKYNNPKKELNEYLKKVEEDMIINGNENNEIIDREKIKKYIEKHPYFKNPCNYHIRLLTIMKYLKKKGFNINIKDMDLIVDEIIQEIDGVKKVGEGRYIRVIKGRGKS
ncbi:hypothetical protein SAMN02745883_00506 [Caminicella sporogenes DSM 14501]|uniref:Uncharacterized protein n=1 Tax=Caminicella sporogenes DSM 14501 TaxID=1121266 RepID=A0A1M6MEK3_9FIRM|nr:hypothetical protein [Caminicella sporogenes]RKD27585.1 hypothetical protein BET04_00505 [Caminicella sporogenes]WIF94829.1 hypothetical protein QNI18_11290 [Caminicella sporogenes]SHJ81770.1 hypothetical protein SAMN02745883_00506 [Caminicella sporogenes DSM 14501]